MTFSLKFLGACEEVGRSSFLLKTGKANIVLDRGIKLLNEELESFPSDIQERNILHPLPIKEKIDAMVLSHAHLDHSGLIPELYNNQSFITYMTPPTLELSRLLWFDSIKIAKKNQMIPDFSEEEIQKAANSVFQSNTKKQSI